MPLRERLEIDGQATGSKRMLFWTLPPPVPIDPKQNWVDTEVIVKRSRKDRRREPDIRRNRYATLHHFLIDND